MKLKEILGLVPEKKKSNRLILILTVFFIFLLLLIITPVFAYQYIYKDKIYLGVSIDGINVGGLNKEQARDKLNQRIDSLKMRGLNFYYKDDKLNIDFTALSPTDPDLAFPILSFDVDAMADLAFRHGRSSDFFTNLLNQITAVLQNPAYRVNYALNETELRNILINRFRSFDQPGNNASIKYLSDNKIEINPEIYGLTINYDEAIADLKKEINLNSINDIKLKTKLYQPTVNKKEAELLIPKVKEIIAVEKIMLIYGEKKWIIYKDEFKKWLVFDKLNDQAVIVFNQGQLTQKLASIAQSINISPQDAKFVITDNKVVEFIPSQNGLELEIQTNCDKINQEFLSQGKTEINVIVKEAEPKIKTADANTLGIKEIIGIGVSDFSGSHTNRIKNIKNAVNHLNGILIPPGEFSTIDAIGPVDASTGYFPEFVIKGDRTIPEYGGGLCQIGTTMFRAALYSGLPITERRPHSYIVSYYKPLGMDATIYGPHPDLRFLNDTGYNILLQIKIEGTKLTFEFWGTNDGRKIEITDPVLYNWTSIPADRLVENPKLKPGDKKLMETGRRGADAYFYRNITLASGEKIEEIIRSHYIPWPNIYEIGVQPVTTPAAETDITSTDNAVQGGSSGNQNINGIN
ncbi:VanW family protein [Candidatus Falkowbacteria bacterium]|nr:VanW family protein [Candidatus Falkowbacteria bacterium]